jgi:hypothetical protein
VSPSLRGLPGLLQIMEITRRTNFNPGEERSSSKKWRNGGSMTMTGMVPVHPVHME